MTDRELLKAERKRVILALIKNKWTYREIGELYGFSKQRVYQIVKE